MISAIKPDKPKFEEVPPAVAALIRELSLPEREEDRWHGFRVDPAPVRQVGRRGEVGGGGGRGY